MDVRDMTDEQLDHADAELMAANMDGRRLNMTPEHFAVKAELGRRATERARREAKERAAKKAAATRSARKAAGLPPRRREKASFNNAPPGGWTDADRVA